MVSLENAQAAVQKSRANCEQIMGQFGSVPEGKSPLVVYIPILDKAQAYIQHRESTSDNQEQIKAFQEAESALKVILNEMLKGIESAFSALKAKQRTFEEWDTITTKLSQIEVALDKIGEQHNGVVERIQNAREEQRKAAMELNLIMMENTMSQVSKPQTNRLGASRPGEANSPPCKLLTEDELDESKIEDGLFEESVYIDEAQIMGDHEQNESDSQSRENPLSLEGWEVRECAKKKDLAQRAVEKLEQQLNLAVDAHQKSVWELEAFKKHKEDTIAKVKVLRKELCEGLANESKELGTISSLLDYMNKPVLSRDLGIGIVDGLTTDLASLVQQTTIEINRQKRILKLIGKGEDYSHEERVYEEMLSENINRIREELGRLNEERIPRLKEVEQVVGSLEAENMMLRETLNQTLDTIEKTEQQLLERLGADADRGTISGTDIGRLFDNCGKLVESGYPEYVLSKVFDQAGWLAPGHGDMSGGMEGNTVGVAGGKSGMKHSVELEGMLEQEMWRGEDSEEDSRLNEAIIKSQPKKLFSKVLATFAAEYSLYRTRVLNKLAEGVVVCKQTKVFLGRSLCPVKYWEESQKKKKPLLETFGYQKQLLKFDWDQGKLLFYSNKIKSVTGGVGRQQRAEEDTGVVARWVLEDEIELDDFIDFALSETSSKLVKARLVEFYKPSQLGVYNQAELAALQSCPFVQFALEFEGRTKVECLANDFGIFLDIYVGLMFLQHE